MICPNISSPNIICRAPVDPLNQRVFSYLSLGSSILVDSVDYNVEWVRALSDNMSMWQELGGTWWVEPLVAHSLGVTDSVESSVDRPCEVSDSIGISDSFVWTGTADDGSGGGSGPELIDAIFDVNTKKGMALYVPSAGHVDLSQADSGSTTKTIGLAYSDVLSSVTGKYQTEGTITQSDWSNVTGSASLTPGAYYYLSESVAGGLTTISPSTITEYVVAVARAVSNTQLDIEISQPILL